MFIVLQTQFCENYAAHDWDGQGECPSYWKYKGGSTYIVKNVSLEQAQDDAFWKRIENAVSHSDHYSKEYVIQSELVDDVDFDESRYVDEWEAPIYIELIGGSLVATETRGPKQIHGFRKEVVKAVKQWLIEMPLDEQQIVNQFTMIDGSILDWNECQEWFRKLNEKEEAELV